MKENVLAAELLQLDDKGAFDQFGKFQEYRAIEWKIQYNNGRPELGDEEMKKGPFKKRKRQESNWALRGNRPKIMVSTYWLTSLNEEEAAF